MDCKGRGVFGAGFNYCGVIVAMHFYLIEWENKQVFAHFSFMNEQMRFSSHLGELKDNLFQSMEGVSGYKKIVIPNTDIENEIKLHLAKAKDREAILFCWEKNKLDDAPFFSASNITKNNAPEFTFNLGLSVNKPFFAMSETEVKDIFKQ